MVDCISSIAIATMIIKLISYFLPERCIFVTISVCFLGWDVNMVSSSLDKLCKSDADELVLILLMSWPGRQWSCNVGHVSMSVGE